MKNLILLILLIGFASCSGGFRQEYETFEEFDEASLRAKGWFPDCVGSDAFNFKSVSDLDPLYGFSKFEYIDAKFYDSILNTKDYAKIEFSDMLQAIEKHSEVKPDWFIDLGTMNNEELIYRKFDRWHIINNSVDKTIYGLITN
ncbi:hypothetical protein [Parvicella tangerina]|uniref:YbbD head domain-containing protein n=1 Tax=Parvicella tangerina TaxID=2829795 RepID=A0A916JIW5_9FLAO|nr:hypothetical protein [Parvicella tangerina]CAG5076637.1 hypothetical protein CRYO30217_00158 [Parvicella tangerina]